MQALSHRSYAGVFCFILIVLILDYNVDDDPNVSGVLIYLGHILSAIGGIQPWTHNLQFENIILFS